MKRTITFLLSALLVVAGCSKNDRQVLIKGYEIKDISGVGFGKGYVSADVTVTLDIENQTSRECSLESLSAVMYRSDGSRFADLAMNGTASIGGNISEKIDVPLKATFNNPFSMLSSGVLSGGKFDPAGITTDIDIKIKAGVFSKEIHKTGIPLEE